MCYSVGGDYRCLENPPLDDASTPGDDVAIEEDAAIDAMPDALIDAMPDAAVPITLMYTAAVADCIEPGDPDPDECLDVNGAMAIDANDTATQEPWVAYVRFDVDGGPLNKTVLSVRLRMTTTNEAKSVASNSGVVWHVQPFTHLGLFTAEPAVIGANPIAPTQGAVTPSDVVEWPLPTTIVTANAGVFLEITTPDDDGTVYGNLATTFPPKLIVVVQ